MSSYPQPPPYTIPRSSSSQSSLPGEQRYPPTTFQDQRQSVPRLGSFPAPTSEMRDDGRDPPSRPVYEHAMSFPQRPEDNHNHLESHLGGSGSGGKQTSSARKRSNGGSGGGVTQSAKDAPPKAAGSARKRARGSSVSKPQNVTPPSPPGTSDHYNGNGNGNGDGNDNRNDNRNGHLKSAESPAPPAVLIREKKQKACANCRRAKLKCIVDDGETDCIRCKARKEKCVFYPRGHDEDWQQTLTGDVYSALSHLSHLSSAVHHLLYHLSAQNIIPPFRTEEGDTLGRYEVPERDMAVLQGWGAERNKELGEPRRGAKRKDPSSGRDERDEEDEYGVGVVGDMSMSMPVPGAGAVPIDPRLEGRPHRQSTSSSMGSTQTQAQAQTQPFGNGFPTRQMSMPVDRFPPSGWSAPGPPGPQGPPGPPGPVGQPGPHFDPLTTPDPTRFAAELPPFRPQGHPGQVQLTPTSELDIPQPQPHYYTNTNAITMSPQTATHISMLPPPPAAHQLPLGPGHGPAPAPAPIVSPSSIQNATPTSLPLSSPAVEPGFGSSTDSLGFPQHPPPTHSAAMFAAPLPQLPIETGGEIIESIIPDNILIGVKDHRADIISQGIVSQQNARTLLTFFHQRLAPLLFGYRLELGKFPYLPDGPGAITPLILGVICLFSSERLPQFMSLHAPIAEVVHELLLKNPAESWQSLDMAKSNSEQPASLDVDRLDPELGIGPEEIIAATVVSLFMSDREQAAKIAESAFRWARGWIKMLSGPPRNSVAELMQIVPAERVASGEDMARVWLLCYIVEGTEIIISGNVGPGLDPEPHCQTLLSAPEPHVSDVVLTSHARLVHTLREWFVQRQAIHRNSAGSTEATRQMQHLTMDVNARLEWWHDDLKAQPRLRAIPPQAMRETVLFWQFARAVVNEIGAAALQAQPRLRASRVMESVDGAMEFLELCAAWEPKMDLANLPQNYLHMVSTLARIVRSAFDEPTCPITPHEASALLRTVGHMLHAGSLPPQHNSRNAADSCLGYAEEISQLVKG